MSTISLSRIGMPVGLKEMGKAKTKVKEKVKIPSTSSHDYHVILGLSCLFFGVLVASLMIVQPVITSLYGSPSMDDVSKCTHKIIGFEQSGFYTSQAQFKVAESYCYIK
jgi:hypothetical protein